MKQAAATEVGVGVPRGSDGRVALRPLPLHLHELALYCNQLANVRQAEPKGDGAPATAPASTEGIGKWLMLSAELEEVRIDTGQFQEAQDYCGPIADRQQSDAMHRGSLATRLTRFVFFCNALEEAYRFSEQTYDRLYGDPTSKVGLAKKLNTASMKAGAVIHELADERLLPADFSELVRAFDKLTEQYEAELDVSLKIFGFEQTDVRNGLDLVRCLRNHVAHGTFPILENPRYSTQMSEKAHAVVLSVLDQAVRIGALYIQLLLSVDNDGIQAPVHLAPFDEDDIEYGPLCWSQYLLTLHCQQPFGLNEVDYFKWRRGMQEARDAEAEALELDAASE